MAFCWRKCYSYKVVGICQTFPSFCPERKILKVSINADAASMGKAVVEAGSGIITEKLLKGHLAILFTGHNAERLILGDHSAGCSSDISKAKRIAADMIEQLAMGEFVVTTVMDLLKEADKTATDVLNKNKERLIKIAELLCERETILGNELVKDFY